MTSAADDAKVLLNALACSGHVATGLSVIKDRCDEGKDLRQEDVSNLELYVDTLHNVERVGRQNVVRMCTGGSYVITGYDMNVAAERREDERNTLTTEPYFMRKLREFRGACKKRFGIGKTKSKKRAPSMPPPPPSAKKASRSSKRQRSNVTPDKADKDLLKEYSGKPRFPHKRWSRETLCYAMKDLDDLNAERATRNEKKLITPTKFMEDVVKEGKTEFKDRSSISRMYKTFLETGVVPEGRGRPRAFDVDELHEKVKNKMNERTSDSSEFKLEHMEKVFSEEKVKEAEQNGLESETVKFTVADATLKNAMMAAVMKSGESGGLGMSNKKVATKTEKRFQAEHSVMGAYAYATTVLSTHFIEGPRPSSLKFQPMKMSKNAKETVEWVKEAFGADEVHPVNPNLVLSTDDTTLFVFEGATNDGCIDKWEWKIYDKTDPASSVHSDFQVGDDVQMAGGLRVRLTFTFTASGLAAPPYVAVSGLTEEELSPLLCEDGILAEPIPGLCKGGDDLFNEGFGWLVFLRADRKNNKKDQEEATLSIANKKFMHYNDKVLLPFIRSIREKLGWKKDQPIPDYLKACSWFDGDIGQLQTMIDEAREALDEAEKICRNKHSAASTGRQQPADLSPVFRLIKAFQLNATAKDDVACGLAETIDEYFSTILRLGGLNLDGNPRKKKALIDFLLCLPEMLERSMLKKHIKRGFIEAGMIDEETGCVPVFENLMGTCIRWGSADKNVGIQRTAKSNCREKFQDLMRIQMDNGQISYTDMANHDIPRDIDSKNQELDYVRPSGADAEHRQPAKTINAKAQKKLREEKRKRKLTEKHVKAAAERDVINIILQRNGEVEEELLGMREDIDSLADITVSDLLRLKKPQAEKLKAFIHVRKFNCREFKQSQLAGSDGKLNLLRYKNQSAESIEADCSEEAPCLVWYAWKVRSDKIVLSAREVPALDAPMVLPQFTVTSARPKNKKQASEYLNDPVWIAALSSAVKGATMIPVSEELRNKADCLCSSLEARLSLHVSGSRVDRSKQNHWTVRLFTRENLPAMAAAICIFGHIVEDDVTTYGLDDCLLRLPNVDEGFQLIDGDDSLGKLQGCYLYFDWTKCRWIRSGKTSGEGRKANFRGRGDTHKKNAKSVDQMKEHNFYAKYPAMEADKTIGMRKGYFDDLAMYCGMAFDPAAADDVSNLCSNGEVDSLFVWSNEVMRELNSIGGELQKIQLDAVAYLWELCYDLLLDDRYNVSVSPGFESLGLRVNRTRKRKEFE